MPRTRDLVLFTAIVGFLLVGIGATVVAKYSTATPTLPEPDLSAVPQAEYPAEVVTTKETLDRAARLATLRQKIEESEAQYLSMPPAAETAESAPTPVEEAGEDTPGAPNATSGEEEITEPTDRYVTQCPSYVTYSTAWPPQPGTVEVAVVEGARLVYQERLSAPEPAPLTAPSTTATSAVSAAEPTLTRVVLLQLPIRLGPAAAVSCLPYDVIGIAKDGSLIRNGEAALYGIFGPRTIIGYALDGFPIYGAGDEPSDACGGVMVEGQYRYQLSPERDTILNCFSAPPVILP